MSDHSGSSAHPILPPRRPQRKNNNSTDEDDDMAYQSSHSKRQHQLPPLADIEHHAGGFWSPSMVPPNGDASSDAYLPSPDSYNSWSPYNQPKLDANGLPNSYNSAPVTPAYPMQSAPRRLSGLSELLPAHRQPDYQYQAPYSAPPGPYDVPRLRRTGSIAGSYVSTVPSSAGLNTPASSFRHLADASPRRDSYYSVHSEDGEHSQRSNSPVDTVHSRHSGNDRDTPSAQDAVSRQHVASAAIRGASEARRSRDARFQCDVPGCGSNFTTKSNLQGHLRSHMGERPYVCQVGCGKAFTRQSDRHRHEDKVHPEVKVNRPSRRRRSSPSAERSTRGTHEPVSGSGIPAFPPGAGGPSTSLVFADIYAPQTPEWFGGMSIGFRG